MTYEQWVQSRLVLHGFAVPVDGDWGRVSINQLRNFQAMMGLAVTGVADAATEAALKAQPADAKPDFRPAPAQTMPPWMAELHRRMGLHEVTHKASLIDFLKIGKFLGDPARLPWCGDAIESAVAKVLPNEPVPSNPFWAQAWASFGIDVREPIVGAIGVIRWSEKAGHVGVVAGVEGDKVILLGGNQSNAITLASFPRDRFIAFRWPKTYPVKAYPPLRGKAVALDEGATR